MPLGQRVFVERHKTKAKAILYLRWWQEQKAKVTVQAVIQNVALAAKAQAEKMRLWPTGTTRWEWRASTWVVGASATGRWNVWKMPADLILRCEVDVVIYEQMTQAVLTWNHPVLPSQTTSISNRGCSLKSAGGFVTLKIVVAPQK